MNPIPYHGTIVLLSLDFDDFYGKLVGKYD